MKFLPYVLLAVLSVLGVWQYKALKEAYRLPAVAFSAKNGDTDTSPQGALKTSFNSLVSKIKVENEKRKLAAPGERQKDPLRTNKVNNENKASALTYSETNIVDKDRQNEFDSEEIDITTLDVNTAELIEPNVLGKERSNLNINELVSMMAAQGVNTQWQSEIEAALTAAKEQLPMLESIRDAQVDCRETVCAVNIAMSEENIQQLRTMNLAQSVGIVNSDAAFSFDENSNEVVVYLTNTTTAND